MFTSGTAPLNPWGFKKFTLFYGGPFSQWYYAPFTVDGVKYNGAEQYMMAQKAALFRDVLAYERIMKSSDPSQQKDIGKTVLSFDKAVWESVARDVVMRASLAKFTSSPALYAQLIETRGTLLVEASPSDVIWGVGLGEYDDAAHDMSKWRGPNWLGQVLTELREHLLRVKGLVG